MPLPLSVYRHLHRQVSHPDLGHAVAISLSSADLDERHSAVSMLTTLTIEDLEEHATDIVDAIMRLEVRMQVHRCLKVQ